VTGIYRSAEGKAAIEGLYRAVLQHWPVPYRHVMLPTREGETSVIASGNPHSTPLMLFHGSGTNATSWIRDVGEWSQHYRVYAVDMIGEPGPSAPSRPPLASDRYAAWLDDVWTQLGLNTAHVAGHFAWRLARARLRTAAAGQSELTLVDVAAWGRAPEPPGTSESRVAAAVWDAGFAQVLRARGRTRRA
jgi:hypothetical protein